MTTDETKQNLVEMEKLIRFAIERDTIKDLWVADDTPAIHEEKIRKWDRINLAAARQLFRFATGNYVIGTPTDESVLTGPHQRTCITAGMLCGSMSGIIMWRDNELTAHS